MVKNFACVSELSVLQLATERAAKPRGVRVRDGLERQESGRAVKSRGVRIVEDLGGQA